jgi:hypothetical protein
MRPKFFVNISAGFSFPLIFSTVSDFLSINSFIAVTLTPMCFVLPDMAQELAKRTAPKLSQ